MNEIWVPVIGYEGFYCVSNLGTIKSLPRDEKTKNKWGEFIRHRKEKILKYSECYRYHMIELYKNGSYKKYLVHRIVYESFFGKIDNGFLIHHIDGNKKNNNISNLQITTSIEHNNIHSHPAWNKGLIGFRGGEKRDSKIYDSIRKKIICNENKQIFNSIKNASDILNIPANSISANLNGRRKNIKGYSFAYIN